MRVKIGDQWFEPTPGAAIMLEIDAYSRGHIAHMAPDATKYAVFSDDDPRTDAEKREWME